MEKKRTRHINSIIKSLFSLGLCFFLLKRFDFQQGIDLTISWAYLPLVFLPIAGAYALRARIYFMSINSTALTYPNVYWVTGLYNFLSSLLPFGIGHLSFGYLLKKYFHVPFGYAIGILATYNVVRVLLLLLLLLIALLQVGQSFSAFSPLLLFGLAVIIAFAGLVFFLNRRQTMKPGEKAFIGSERLKGIADAILHGTSATQMPLILFYSVLIIGCNLVRVYCAYAFWGCNLGLLALAFLFSTSNLSNLLPIHGVARLGTHESINVLVMVILGFTSNEAIQLSFAAHLFLLTAESLLALPCYIFLRKNQGISYQDATTGDQEVS